MFVPVSLLWDVELTENLYPFTKSKALSASVKISNATSVRVTQGFLEEWLKILSVGLDLWNCGTVTLSSAPYIYRHLSRSFSTFIGAPPASPQIASPDQGVGGPFSAQLIEVDLKCEQHQGEAVIGVVEELRIPGLNLLLGNDLCRNRVRVDCPMTSVVPLSDSTTEALEMDFPGTFPVCAVTRSLGRVAASPMMQHPGTSSAADDLALSPADTRPSSTPTETEVPDLSKLFVLDSEANTASPILPLDTPQSLMKLQGRDEDDKRLSACAVREEDVERELGDCFYLKDKVLWRRWRLPHLQDEHGVWDVHQVVVPQALSLNYSGDVS
ncbi:hypothetical protein E2C01_019770 [Portunus trituberculatus]|uniref:Uncharacterized protein n=1 Tax=Portunus trituberculatus TaxID=210409 RepID=A0A5B7E0A4_PORTR|nr:hypothetical protein [Portunus trituberculatus]